MTPPFNISARPVFTRSVPVSFSIATSLEAARIGASRGSSSVYRALGGRLHPIT